MVLNSTFKGLPGRSHSRGPLRYSKVQTKSKQKPQISVLTFFSSPFHMILIDIFRFHSCFFLLAMAHKLLHFR